jgi:LacI family transcriptional regulator
MATIKDVARLAGVSTTTVSHVLNGTRFVSDDLRVRVVEAMDRLNYHPNVLARSLRRGETRTIGLIVPDQANPFFAEVARTVEDTGFQNGYNVILCNSDDTLEKEAAYLQVLIAKQVDGVIFIAAGPQQEHLDELVRQGIPFVVADRDIGQSPADVILVNNEQGGYDVTRYLIELGHLRIACIAGPSQLTPSAERVLGYRRALAEAGLPVDEGLIVPGDFRYEGGESAMWRLLRMEWPPTAVFCCNDLMAIGALRAIRTAGLLVPRDVSVAGFDDIRLASAMWPSLTTVAQPIVELATRSVEALIGRMQGKPMLEPMERVVLATKLIVRDSCAPL